MTDFKTPEQIAEDIADAERGHYTDLDSAREAAAFAAIEVYRAQVIASLRDRPEVVPIEEAVRRHAFIKGYEAAIDKVREVLS